MKYLIIAILLLFPASFISRAQYYDTGEDPASVKWLQIKTVRYTLIYPESFGNEAFSYARSLDSSFAKLSAFYPVYKTNYPIVIHNYTTFSNGYVAWAPRRMEIYPTPEQNSIPLDPVEQLTTHEMTHIMQMYSLRKGFSGFLRVALGEQATALASALVPLWVMEGNAVLAESALTPGGRGRAPYFQKQMKAIVTERQKMYSYDNMLLGSFRNHIPDHYQYGYQMAAWGYANWGQKLWNNALDYTSRYPFTIYPVSLSNLKTAGLSNASLYSQTFDTLKTIWSKEISAGTPAQKNIINPFKGKEYINYYSPVVVGTDSIVAIKTSLFNPPSFMLLNVNNGTEERIHVPGNIYPWFLSGSAGKIVWVEQVPDPRWNNRDYSVIKIKNLRSGEITHLSRNSRYLSASLSRDGRFVAASENSVENRNRLVIIDAFNGEVLNTIDPPGNTYLQRPQWSDEGDRITAITLSPEGEGIISYSLDPGLWKTLIVPGRNDLQSSFLRNDTLFFVSSYSGTDNIYLITPEGKTMMVTDSRFGAYDLFASKDRIYFSDYSSSGFNISSANISEVSEIRDPDLQKNSFLINRFDTLSNRKVNLPETEYNPEPYKKWKHPFRFHSWMPFYADIEQFQTDPTDISPGIQFLSQNTLSTLITSVGYEYADNTHQFHTKITWKGWFPVIESGIDYGADPLIYKSGNQVGNPETVMPGLTFNNSISVPLSFSSGRFSQYLRPSFSASYQNNYVYLQETGTYDYGQTQMTARLYFSNQHQSAMRDIYPRWAQVFDLSGTFFPADKSIYGPLNAIKTSFYFPGFFRNHGLRLRAEADKQEPEKLLLYNRASFPRGYKDIISLNLRFVSADYVMPLFYPDLNIPGMFFLKRIRTGFFYDYAKGTGNQYYKEKVYHDYTETFRSFGTEVLADFHLLRIPFMISAGVQAAWKELNEAPVTQFLFRIDVYGIRLGQRRL
jgi:hypothetical protein